MPNKITYLGGAIIFTLCWAGCTSDGGVGARIHEKSATYAALKPWEQKYINDGVIAVGFTSEMVYMAMGHPTHIEPAVSAAGKGEVWIYNRYYPNAAAARGFQAAGYTPEAPYQASRFVLGTRTPVGMSRNPQSISQTGPPQGGTMEPATPVSFNIRVWLANGSVARVAAEPNFD